MNENRDEVDASNMDGEEIKALAADESALAPIESATEIEVSEQEVIAKKTELEEVIQCEEEVKNEDTEELEVKVEENNTENDKATVDKPEPDDESENLDDSIVAGAPDQAPPSDQTIDLMIDQTKE